MILCVHVCVRETHMTMWDAVTLGAVGAAYWSSDRRGRLSGKAVGVPEKSPCQNIEPSTERDTLPVSTVSTEGQRLYPSSQPPSLKHSCYTQSLSFSFVCLLNVLLFNSSTGSG